MDKYDKFSVPNRAIYPQKQDGKITGFTIFVPSSFLNMVQLDKKYNVTFELKKEEE
jgi:hypothetical protein